MTETVPSSGRAGTVRRRNNTRKRRTLVPGCREWVAVAMLTAAVPAHALDFEAGDWSGAVRSTVTAGTAIRTSRTDPARVPAADAALVGIRGTAPAGVNSDDSNLNYKRGDPVSTVAKAVVDFEANNKDGWGAFLRLKAWYDHTLSHDSVVLGNEPNNYAGGRLSDQGFSRGAKFRGVSLADAYVKGQFSPGGLPLSLKLGQQTIDWGPAFSIPGGLRDINPRDYAALTRPGVQPQEGWVPFLALSGKVDVTPLASLEAFYQFLWERSTLPGCGTFGATADFIAPGCGKAIISSAFTSPGGTSTGRFLKRAGDREAGNAGQFGIGGSYTVPPIGTKFSLYYTMVHSRDPYIDVIRTGRGGTAFLTGDPDGLNPQYATAFPENIKMLSGSFASSIPSVAMKIAGEIDHKFNQPLSFNSLDILLGSLGAGGVLAGDFNRTPLGGTLQGYERFHVTQGQVAASKDVEDVLGGSLTLGGEVGAKYVHGLPDPNFRRYGRADVFGTGPLNGVCPVGADPKFCSTRGFVTPFSWGYRLQTSLSYQDVLPDLNLKPSVGFIHDVSGWSYDGAFNKGRKAIRLGLDGSFKTRYFFNVTYQKTLTGPYDPRSDRNLLVASTGVKF